MGDKKTILKVIEYVEDHLDGKLNLDEVAEEIGYSKFHLNRLFAESVGCTLYKYIQTRRLTQAAQKLVHSRKTIIEIAYEANYDSQQSFTLAFRQLYSITPQKYRQTGIYAPKRNRFTVNSCFMHSGQFTVKSGGAAA